MTKLRFAPILTLFILVSSVSRVAFGEGRFQSQELKYYESGGEAQPEPDESSAEDNEAAEAAERVAREKAEADEDAERTECTGLDPRYYYHTLLVWPSGKDGRAHFYRKIKGQWKARKTYLIAGDAVFARDNAAGLKGQKSSDGMEHLCVWYEGASAPRVEGWMKRDSLRESFDVLGHLAGKAPWPYAAKMIGDDNRNPGLNAIHFAPGKEQILCMRQTAELASGFSCYQVTENGRMANNIKPGEDCGGEELTLFNNGILFSAYGAGCYGNHGAGDLSGFYLSGREPRPDCESKNTLIDRALCEDPELMGKYHELDELYQALVDLKNPALSDLPENQKQWRQSYLESSAISGRLGNSKRGSKPVLPWIAIADKLDNLDSDLTFDRHQFFDHVMAFAKMSRYPKRRTWEKNELFDYGSLSKMASKKALSPDQFFPHDPKLATTLFSYYPPSEAVLRDFSMGLTQSAEKDGLVYHAIRPTHACSWPATIAVTAEGGVWVGAVLADEKSKSFRTLLGRPQGMPTGNAPKAVLKWLKDVDGFSRKKGDCALPKVVIEDAFPRPEKGELVAEGCLASDRALLSRLQQFFEKHPLPSLSKSLSKLCMREKNGSGGMNNSPLPLK